MMKKLLFLWTILIGCSWLTLKADEKISFTASAPNAVVVGDQFRLSYTVTTKNIRDFRVSTIKDFEILMGPSRSQQKSIQTINGKTTSNSSITFTYILLANKEGNFTIPGATITANGSQIVSNSIQIKVLPADNSQISVNSSTVSNKELFVIASVNKTTAYEQEALLLTYKIYTTVNLRGFNNVKLPDFKGFHSQEIELPNDRRWALEHYEGKNYQTTIYRQFVLFPQQAGNLIIEPARFDASIQKMVTQTVDPFDAFFNGGNNYVEVKKTIFTPKLSIKVNALPSNKPSNFSGGVGDFKLFSSINSEDIKTNEAITLKLQISGTGNLKLIPNPEVEFPEDFEIYDPKIDNKFNITPQGLSGTKNIEYLAIPRYPGKYQIPSIEFSYFDIKSNTYKTLKTEAFNIHVQQGEEGETSVQNVTTLTSKEELEVLNEDIRYIKQNDIILSQRGDFFVGSLGYWLYYLIPTILFIISFAIYHKKIAANANIALMRTKRANKIAIKRLKIAGNLLSNNRKEAFYDEILKALWGYVSDKLNMPVSKLSKDNIEEELHNYGVNEDLIKGFLNALNNCEFARFAPSKDDIQAMDDIYKEAFNVISQIEDSIEN